MSFPTLPDQLINVFWFPCEKQADSLFDAVEMQVEGAPA